MIDREHIASLDDYKNELINYGFQIVESNMLGDGSCCFKAVRGSNEVIVYVAVSGCGIHGKIECNLARLIQMRYNAQVEPDKKAIRRWLKEIMKRKEHFSIKKHKNRT